MINPIEFRKQKTHAQVKTAKAPSGLQQMIAVDFENTFLLKSMNSLVDQLFSFLWENWLKLVWNYSKDRHRTDIEWGHFLI